MESRVESRVSVDREERLDVESVVVTCRLAYLLGLTTLLGGFHT